MDCSIHDIDLALWLFDQERIVKLVVASGITAVQPELRRHGGSDNVIGIDELYGCRNAYFCCLRTMAAGEEDSTEIIGTEGNGPSI